MQLTRRKEAWDPFHEFEDLSNRMNRLFGLTKWSPNGGREALATTDWAPACDISETNDTYDIYAELPAVKKGDVHVTLQDNVLTIQGERKETKEDKGLRFHRRELSYGSFMRSFTMPDDADGGQVDAKFHDGILEVVIRKAKGKSVRSKEILVH